MKAGKAYNGTYLEFIYNGRAFPKKSSKHATVIQNIEN